MMASVLSGDGGGGGGGGKEGGSAGGGRGRVQHDTDRTEFVRSIDAPDEDADGPQGCFAGDASCDAASEAASVSGEGGGVGHFVDDHTGDAGMCMSMHQPWASLAVYGVKQIEGESCLSLPLSRLLLRSVRGDAPCSMATEATRLPLGHQNQRHCPGLCR